MKHIAKIPIANIDKVKIYVNNYRKPLSVIKKETGADYIMNGGFFNWNWTSCPILKVNGELLADAQWGAWGYAWNNGEDIHIHNVARDTTNFISGVSLVNPWDGEHAKLYYRNEIGGMRGRTAMGMDSNNLYLYCSSDGSSDAKTPEQLRDEMVDIGCKSCIMLDGGGSSQCDFTGNKIASSRIVYSLVLVFLKNGSKPQENKPVNVPKENSGVSKAKNALSSKFKYPTSQGNTWGVEDTTSLIKAVQKSINKVYGKGLSVDGSWGPASKKACPTLKRGSKNDVVYCAQIALNKSGLSTDIDGSFGPNMENAVKNFQTKVGLTANGIAGLSFFNNILR